MPQFVPGLSLSRQFFEEAVRPIVRDIAPNLRFAAGLIGSGSEVLGFDDEMSADHHWGPRVMVFVEDRADQSGEINRALRDQLPPKFLDYPTNFTEPDRNDNNVQQLVMTDGGPINHRVEISTIREYFIAYLDFDIDDAIDTADWLTFPEQKLRSLSAKNIFHDEIGLRAALDRFKYYPHDVWLYLLAAGWNRIGQEEHLMGRAGHAGDEIGSALIAARLVRDIMRLCFLMEKQYAPYPKWFGTAFRQLKCGAEITPYLEHALRATNWQNRESHLVNAYELIAAMHNALRITEPLPTKSGNFFGRPFKVMHLIGDFSERIRAEIMDAELKRIAANKLIGSIDQISDNTDLLSDPHWRGTLKRLYE